MKILTVGGGSGGHVTPVVAVLKVIKSKHPRADIRFWCDRKFINSAKNIVANFDKSIRVETIIAGKLRRYHHLSLLRQLTWPSLVLSNIRDGFLVFIGLLQSLVKLIIWRPDVVFTKGGYVCLPVGMAAKILNIPLVIHDSDAHPGLTNRILSRWASQIATGAPLEFYNYPKNKSHHIGVPIDPSFYSKKTLDDSEVKASFGINSSKPLIVVTGGGLGAKRINDTIISLLDDLLTKYAVVLISGTSKYDELKALTPTRDDFSLEAFIEKDIANLFRVADLVITRAGATTILELAALKKPTILIPNARLTGGHQIKNAKVYSDKFAVEVINEDDMVNNPKILLNKINQIMTDDELSNRLSRNIAKFSKPKAAEEMAQLILRAIK